jgi:hypothetical protein
MSPGAPQAAHVPVAVPLAPWQMSPEPQAIAAGPAQQMSPAAAPQATQTIAVEPPPAVVQRAPVWQLLLGQQGPFGAPQSTQKPA